jgi:type VI secretion system secreted protein Hcp
MAVDMFLKLKDVPGESIDKQYKGCIDILSWSWGMAQAGTTHSGSGGGAGKVSVADLTITKYIDKSSLQMTANSCSGKHIDSGSIYVRKAGGDKPLTYIEIDMTEIIISSVSIAGTQSDELIMETIGLNFSKFAYTYYIQKDDGTGTKVGPISWDIAKNTK